MFSFLVGFASGVLMLMFYPEILTLFIDSGVRDAMIERLQSL